jgi:hypothetical protein
MIDFAIKHHYDYVDASYDKDYGFPTAMNFIVNNQEKGDGVSYKIHDFNIRYTISFPPINSKPVAKASEPDSKPPATSAPGQQLQ